MIEKLKSIANELANTRVRLSKYDDQKDEIKILEYAERNLRKTIFDLEERINNVLL